MSLFIASLNSGSNGNCYYVGNNEEAVLIDAGISCRETDKRMNRLGLSMKRVKAIFISHEHGDHIHGVEVISRKYQVPVYITPATLGASRIALEPHLACAFTPHIEVKVGSISVTAFPKLHDAIDPHSFVVQGGGVTIGVFTDIGVPCSHVSKYFRRCHAAFLEANYDEHMLANGRYPAHLKKRISSDVGHMSNTQALDLFINHGPSFMTHLLLSHLSRDNNNPELATIVFDEHRKDTYVTVASRYRESAVYHIVNYEQTGTESTSASAGMQMSLF